MARLRNFLVTFVGLLFVSYAVADEGVLNSEGCHYALMTGAYHCHHIDGSTTFPDPSRHPRNRSSTDIDRELPEGQSWKNVNKLGYASVGLFGEVGSFRVGEMNFEGVDQTCDITGNGPSAPRTCNHPSKLMDFGAYGEANIGLFDMESFSLYVGAEIGRAVTYGGKFFNCSAGEWDWKTCDSEQSGFRGSRGKLNGYSYGDIKIGMAGQAPRYLSELIGEVDGQFAFAYLLSRKVEYSSDWGTYSDSEFGFGLDLHFSQYSSARVNITDSRGSFGIRVHF